MTNKHPSPSGLHHRVDYTRTKHKILSFLFSAVPCFELNKKNVRFGKRMYFNLKPLVEKYSSFGRGAPVEIRETSTNVTSLRRSTMWISATDSHILRYFADAAPNLAERDVRDALFRRKCGTSRESTAWFD